MQYIQNYWKLTITKILSLKMNFQEIAIEIVQQVKAPATKSEFDPQDPCSEEREWTLT